LALALTSFSLVCGDVKGGLQIIPKGGDEERRNFVSQQLEPRHAVAVLIVGQGTKRHRLFEDVAKDTDLEWLLVMGVQFARSGSSITMHRYKYPTETYTGKWTSSAIRAWLVDMSYPPVNRMRNQFSPPKYLTATSFGTVLIVKPLANATDELVEVLEPYAQKYRDQLKFTFFTKTASTQPFCDQYGVWTNDELLLLEKPRQANLSRSLGHSHEVPPPIYRLEEVSRARIDLFFKGYAAGTWPRYHRSLAPRATLSTSQSIRQLSGWDFAPTVNDPDASVLVEFVSKNCGACDEFAQAYGEVARRVQQARQKESGLLKHTIVARLDQSRNEHSERVTGTPWMKYWPRGRAKRPVDVELRNIDSIMEFLEEHASEEAEALGRSESVVGEVDSEEEEEGKVDGTSCRAQRSSGCSPDGSSSEGGSGGAASGLAAASGDGVLLGDPVPQHARGYLSTEADLGDENA